MAEADLMMERPATEALHAPVPRRSGVTRVLMFAVPLIIVAIAAFLYWQGQQGKVSTDNAYLKQYSVGVTTEVAGPIAEVFVQEGDEVAKGDLLLRIDQEPFRLALQQANARLASAQANVTALSNDANLSGSDIGAARENISFAQSRLDRQEALWQRGFTTKADYEAAQHSVEQARDELRSAEARQREARSRLATGTAVPGVNPQVASALAQRAEAELNLRRTEIRAPAAGQIAEADRLLVGEMAVTGLPLLQIVSRQGTYVEANFKETELDHIQVGQPVEIRIDAYQDVRLKGRVVTIGAGTGSEFSVLPAQNASGNWVKVTQRVPVRIAIDSQSPRKLIAGLSASVTIFTGN
ncbi:HlyD family secretion protein [Croceicoccus sp. F390]|uniref:HlyD family secretion protein n=1 Tax=Croceicoccus esteveae TaxID=3075597 RepID=A0ABU2ZDW7_9SPHN|nr:HlyD family secretion protein [Croceicoccus sp. F390]MDT0574793.1 HlyD family secretion protein [Croceicoccus sp. F390]